MKLNDIFTTLNRTIKLEKLDNKKSVLLKDSLSINNTNDLTSNLSDLDLGKKSELILSKNKTKNFDALSKETFLFKLKNPIKLNNEGILSRKIISNKETDSNNFSKIDIITKNTKLNLDEGIKKLTYSNFLIKRIKNYIRDIKLYPFYIILFFLILGFLLFLDKNFIESRVNFGYKRLIELKENPYNISFIKKQINDAKLDFTISNIAFIPFRLLDNLQINNAYHIISGGKLLTTFLDKALLVYDKTLVFIREKKIEQIELTGLLLNLREEFLIIGNNLDSTIMHFKEVKGLNDIALQDKLNNQIQKLEIFSRYTNILNTKFNSLLNILGHYESKKYLLVFQNSDEIRPTGGFMGSMGIIEVFRGKIKSFEKRDIYAYEWDLKKVDYNRLVAPEGLNKITETFGLRDANYFVNLENSSKSIKFFIEKAGYNIDGIIYINQNILLDFLDETGNIDFEELGVEIDSSNFSEIMSTLVEAKTYKIGTLGTPKKILFDFMEVFIKKLQAKGDYFTYLKIIQKSIEKRDIIFYSFNKENNEFLKELGLNMDINFVKTLDFSYPVFTSISGNKSDRYMERNFKKNIFFNDNCSLKTSLKLISKHTFSIKDEEKLKFLFKKYNIKDKKIFKIQGAGDNYQFVRILLPKDAIIKKKENIIIRDYKSIKTVEFYLKTKRGEVTNFTIDYELQNEDCKKYDFMFYKQAGIKKYDIEINTTNNNIKENGLKQDFYYGDL